MAKNNLFHASPSIIIELRPEPMWFSYSEDISKGYYDFSEGALKYIHEYELTGGHFLSVMGIRNWCYDNGVDYEKMESELRDNPDSIYDIDGVSAIAEKCDGFEHHDHSPVDGLEEILALLVFDPSKNIRLVNINNVEDEENDMDEGAMTDVGVTMGKKTSLSESILFEAAEVGTFDDWVYKYSEKINKDSEGNLYFVIGSDGYDDAINDMRKLMRLDDSIKKGYMDKIEPRNEDPGYIAFRSTMFSGGNKEEPTKTLEPVLQKNGKPKRVPTIKKGDIHGIFGDASNPTYRGDAAMVKALLYLFDRQTDDEQHSESTNQHNRMGFTGTDAQLLSSFAKQVIQKAWLSPRQMQVLRGKIQKYAGQIAKVANVCRKEGKDGVISDQAKKWAQANAKNYEMRNDGTENYYLKTNT